MPASTDHSHEFDHAEIEREIKHDYSSSTHGIVPLDARRGTWTHHVPLWITLYAGFSYLALGAELYSYGYTLARMTVVVIISAVCYLLYAIPAAYLGATRGQTTTLLSRSVFGLSGSFLVSALVLITPLGWVGYQSNTLASIWNGLYGWTPVVGIGVIIAVVGITNNVFGFTGITVFARWVAGPLTVLWVIWMVCKGLTQTNGHVLSSHMPGTSPTALPIVTGVIIGIGFATYGNEPDLFRYAKPSLRACIPPLVAGLFFGVILFPIAGWIIAARVQSGDFGKGVAAAVDFSLFGFAFIAFLLATATQIAINDANYYESLNAGQNLLGGWHRWRRIFTCIIIAIGGGFMAWWVPQSLTNFFRATTFLAVTVPSATVIMYTDQLLLPKLAGIRRRLDTVPAWDQVAFANWPAIVSLIIAILFGSYGSGIMPGQDGSPLQGWGVVPLEAWLLGGAIYAVLALIVARTGDYRRLLGFPATAIAAEANPASPVSDIQPERVG